MSRRILLLVNEPNPCQKVNAQSTVWVQGRSFVHSFKLINKKSIIKKEKNKRFRSLLLQWRWFTGPVSFWDFYGLCCYGFYGLFCSLEAEAGFWGCTLLSFVSLAFDIAHRSNEHLHAILHHSAYTLRTACWEHSLIRKFLDDIPKTFPENEKLAGQKNMFNI